MICNSQYFGSCCCLIIRWYFSVAGTICQNSSFQANCVCNGVLNQGDSCVDFGSAGDFPGKISCCETAPVKTTGKFGYLPHDMQLSHSCLIIRWYFSVAGLFCDTSTRRLDRNPNPIAPPTGICVAAPTKSRKSSFILKKCIIIYMLEFCCFLMLPSNYSLCITLATNAPTTFEPTVGRK